MRCGRCGGAFYAGIEGELTCLSCGSSPEPGRPPTPAEEAMARLEGRGSPRTSPPSHGTRACYKRGCRREECTAANNRYHRTYQAQHTG